MLAESETMKLSEKDILSICDTIKERTEENDHNQALITASILLDGLESTGETPRTKILKHLRELQRLVGYMSSGLLELRESYRKPIMSGLSRRLHCVELEALKRSF